MDDNNKQKSPSRHCPQYIYSNILFKPDIFKNKWCSAYKIESHPCVENLYEDRRDAAFTIKFMVLYLRQEKHTAWQNTRRSGSQGQPRVLHARMLQ